jgi:hypothetical protein
MLSETCPSINSPDCGFDRGAAMRVPVIEMRVLEDKTLASVSFACQTLPDSGELLDAMAWKLQTVGSSASVPAPECLPVGLLHPVHRLVSAVAPNARKPIQTAPKAMVSSLLPTAKRILLLNAIKFIHSWHHHFTNAC